MTAAVSMSTGPKVLLVDDNPDDVARFERLFRSQGWNIFSASNGDECVRALTEGPDVIVLDYLLGDALGTDVLRRIRAMGIQTPVIVHSGTPAVLTARGGLPDDALGFVSKNSTEYAKQMVALVHRAATVAAVHQVPEPLSMTTIEEILASLVDPGSSEFVCAALAVDRGPRVFAHVSMSRSAPAAAIEALARLAKTGPSLEASLNEAHAQLAQLDFGGSRACLAPVPGFGVLLAATSGPNPIPLVGTDAVRAAAAAFHALAASNPARTTPS